MAAQLRKNAILFSRVSPANRADDDCEVIDPGPSTHSAHQSPAPCITLPRESMYAATSDIARASSAPKAPSSIPAAPRPERILADRNSASGAVTGFSPGSSSTAAAAS